jgi:hypothetical protein
MGRFTKNVIYYTFVMDIITYKFHTSLLNASSSLFCTEDGSTRFPLQNAVPWLKLLAAFYHLGLALNPSQSTWD